MTNPFSKRTGPAVLLLALGLITGACTSAPHSAGPAPVTTSPQPEQSWKYIDPALVKPTEVLPAPGNDNSFENTLVARLRAQAGPGLKAAAKEANQDSPFDLIEVLDPSVKAAPSGPALEALKAKYPRTVALLENADADGREATKAAKAAFNRQRPAESGLSSTDTYPSGHATRAALQARLLSALVPLRESDLFEEAWFAGLCRLTLGVHHPTDVTAGFVFGAAVGKQMLEHGSQRFKDDFQAAQKEWPKTGR